MSVAKEAVVDIKFGTDGWRGVMARDFTFDNVRRVAQAIAEHLKDKPRSHGRAIVGYDRRFQSESFALEIARILQRNKFKPILMSEPLPTPAVSFLSAREKAVGVMVTASHNPPAYNGVKIKLEGRAASEETTRAVEACLDRAVPIRDGEVERKSFRKDYLNWLRSRVSCGPLASIKRPIIVDYMHGCAAGLFEELVRAKRLTTLRGRHDPLFGGVRPEPMEKNLGELISRVKKEKALAGFAFDGDADRIGVVDDLGRYLTPCQVFPILAEYLINAKKIKGKIVQSVSLGYLAGRIAKANGLEFEELPVGFKHVAERLALGQAAIGGEESGGYAWKGSQPERDGLLAALLILEICVKTRKTPSQLWADIEKKYGKSHFQRADYRLYKPVVDKRAFAEKIKKRLPQKILGSPVQQIIDIDGLKVILQGDHWVLMRPSGTEPLLRVYAESDSAKRTQELLELGRKWSGAS